MQLNTTKTPLPIIIGSDTELYNAIHDNEMRLSDTGGKASRVVLSEINGVANQTQTCYTNGNCTPISAPYHQTGHINYGYNTGQGYQHTYKSTNKSHDDSTAHSETQSRYNPQDHDRKYSVANGGCNYIDLNHLETCTPEVRLAREFVAVFHANLLAIREAAESATEKLAEGQRIVLLANNVDPFGSSYGGHMNFHISSNLWNKLADRSFSSLAMLLTFKISSIVYTGQGRMTITPQGKPQYRLTQRGLEMKCVRGTQTTFNRPLFNARDEAHCEEARLHDIFYDTNLLEPALYLKAGVNQLILAMLEEDYIDHTLAVDDPLYALRVYDCAPSLEKKVNLINGESITAVDIQYRFFEHAQRFIESGRADLYVGEAKQILEYWGSTLDLLKARDFDRLSRRLDWVLKKRIIEHAIENHSASGWKSPQAFHLDMIYSSLDPNEGVYYQALADNYVERIVSDEDIAYFLHDPPVDTRAWGRTHLLRQLPADDIVAVNWDAIKVRIRKNRQLSTYTVKFPKVHGATEAELKQYFNNTNTQELVEILKNILGS